jgi:hypothetical protein
MVLSWELRAMSWELKEGRRQKAIGGAAKLKGRVEVGAGS